MENRQSDAVTDLESEAEAFNQRIAERTASGYIPDLRRAVKCDYFYKSFWRDPHFARLYLGRYVTTFLEFLEKHGPRKGSLRVLDVGCGPGYVSLELARAGHKVVGIDISDKAIATARRTAESNPYKQGFGSLEYHVRPFHEETGTYDAVVFSGVIHHFSNPNAVVQGALQRIPSGGLLACLEPCHERWRPNDAAVVGLIRGLLSFAGNWYEPELGGKLLSPSEWISYVEEIQVEYVTEKDPHERGQSPNDNACSGEEILVALRKNLVELECRDGFSFIYRLLGGLRGPDEVVHKMADLITAFDRHGVASGYLKPNAFLFAGRKP